MAFTNDTELSLKAAKGMRGIHATRHHAAMQTLRKTKNLRVAQRLLGHADIKSTMVYAHAIEDDVRNALAEVHHPNAEGEGSSPEAAVPKVG